MKYVASTAAAAAAIAMSGSSVLAGSVGPVAVVEPMVVEEPMGMGSGAWIIPLIAIGLIAFVITQEDDNNQTPQVPGPAIP